MDAFANHEEDPPVEFNGPLWMDVIFGHPEIPDNSASNCDAVGEVAPLQPLTNHSEELPFGPLGPDTSFLLEHGGLSEQVINSQENSYSSLGIMGGQGGMMPLRTQPFYLWDYAESSNPCVSPSSLQLDLSLRLSSSEHDTTATEQHRTTGSPPGRFREIRPRPPGLVGTNVNNGQPSTRECKPKARANKHTGDRTRTAPGDKRQPRGRGKKSYVCERCGEDLKDSKKLTRHYRVDHKEWARVTKGLTVEFPCPVPGCTKKSTRKDNLGRHQRNQHPWLNEQYTSVS